MHNNKRSLGFREAFGIVIRWLDGAEHLLLGVVRWYIVYMYGDASQRTRRLACVVSVALGLIVPLHHLLVSV
jgi:hypothetical protein